MIIELDAATDSEERIRAAILSVRRKDDVVVIRRGAKRFDRAGWRDFLTGKCGFLHDRRHYSIDARLELEDWWEISYQPEKATSYAYSNTRQPLHTDNGWFADPAELNFFLMEKQAVAGGEQMLYRVGRLIADLEEKAPSLLRDLSSVQVTIRKGDGEHRNVTEIIRLGEEPKVFWNYYRTEKQAPEVQRMCDAFFKFLELQESTPSVERIRMNSGDCFCFHDQKMLHGRAAFQTANALDRVLFQSMWRIPR